MVKYIYWGWVLIIEVQNARDECVGDFPVAITVPKLHRDHKDLELMYTAFYTFISNG